MTALAIEHQQALINLRALTDADLLKVWRLISGAPPWQIRDALMEAVPAIGDQYGDVAATLAVDFYDEARAEAEARGLFHAQPAPATTGARYEALVRWGVDPLFGSVPDEAGAFSRLAGGLQRIVAHQSRETIAQSSYLDPSASGWRRVTSSGACAFCRMLAGRGAVYSRDTVRFASHDDCDCASSPAFDSGPPITVTQYAASKRRQSESDRRRVREYLAGQDGRSTARPSKRTSAFDAMSREQIENQIRITEGLKESDWRTEQLARLRARLTALDT